MPEFVIDGWGGGALYTLIENIIVGTKFVAPITANIIYIKAKLKLSSAPICAAGGYKTKCAIYSNDGPNIAYIGTSEEKNHARGFSGWVQHNCVPSIPVVLNTKYWVMAWGNKPSFPGCGPSLAYENIVGKLSYLRGRVYDGWPTPLDLVGYTINDRAYSLILGYEVVVPGKPLINKEFVNPRLVNQPCVRLGNFNRFRHLSRLARSLC